MRDDKVTRLPVIERPRDVQFEIIHFEPGKCRHDSSYQLRNGEAEVECGACHTKLDPIFVIRQIAQAESLWKRNREAYAVQAKEAAERSRCKCQHCGRMTRIRGL